MEGNENKKGFFALAAVTLAAFILIWGVNSLTDSERQKTGNNKNNEQKFNIAEYEKKDPGILEAFQITDEDNEIKGYKVDAAVKGYGGEMVVRSIFDEDGKELESVEIVSHSETEGVGSKIAENSFLKKFHEAKPPILLKGEKERQNTPVKSNLKNLKDGKYREDSDEYDSNGFKDIVTMTVKSGKIVNVTWDAVNKDGDTKNKLSLDGKYTMTEDGPLWAEQAEAVERYVVTHQSLDKITVDGQGKTDAIASVSISVNEFLDLFEDCVEDAGGIVEKAEKTDDAPSLSQGTEIDGISGATTSSKALISGINKAYDFLNNFILKK